jgi:hypothetical protein
MTDQDWQELGRRAVACEHWRWMPGMQIDLGGVESTGALRVIGVSRCGAPITRDGYGRLTTWSTATKPDLRDPATPGCLLALVREAAEPERAPGDWPMVCTYQNAAKKWGVGAWLNESGKATFAALVLPTYGSEAAALVAALESAP